MIVQLQDDVQDDLNIKTELLDHSANNNDAANNQTSADSTDQSASQNPSQGTSDQGASDQTTSDQTTSDQGTPDQPTPDENNTNQGTSRRSVPDSSDETDGQIEIPKQIELRNTTIGSLFDGSNSPFSIIIYSYIDGKEINDMRLEYDDVRLTLRAYFLY